MVTHNDSGYSTFGAGFIAPKVGSTPLENPPTAFLRETSAASASSAFSLPFASPLRPQNPQTSLLHFRFFFAIKTFSNTPDTVHPLPPGPLTMELNLEYQALNLSPMESHI